MNCTTESPNRGSSFLWKYIIASKEGMIKLEDHCFVACSELIVLYYASVSATITERGIIRHTRLLKEKHPTRSCLARIKRRGPGRVAQLVRASSHYTKVVD